MPKGYLKPGYILKLKKSLYGLRQAPRLWAEYLKVNLEAIGFVQAVDVDACLFISNNVICVTYVDDTLFFARDMKDIDETIRLLREQQKMSLDVEDDVVGFLGVQINRCPTTGVTTMTQTGLLN